jgi:hypothetical protein
VITSHGTSEAFRNPSAPADGYIEYLRRRAASRAGLIIAQPRYPNPFGPVAPSTVDRHRRPAEAVNAEGAVLLIQLAQVAIALAFGAGACLLGRAYLWGLGAAGEPGCAAAIRMIDDELRRAMQLLGDVDVAQLRERGADLVRRAES